MIIYYCRSRTCQKYIKREYENNDTGVSTIDSKSLLCDDCAKWEEPPAPHHNSLRTHCKRGHLLDGVHTVKGVTSRYCTICARLAEKRHREKNPGYHTKYKRGGK